MIRSRSGADRDRDPVGIRILPAEKHIPAGRIRPPAAWNSASVTDEPRPAPAWTKTSCPFSASSLTPAGVMATRYSWFLTSAGTPIFMVPPIV